MSHTKTTSGKSSYTKSSKVINSRKVIRPSSSPKSHKPHEPITKK